MRPRPAVSCSNTVVCSAVSFSGGISRMRFMRSLSLDAFEIQGIASHRLADCQGRTPHARFALSAVRKKLVSRSRQPEVLAQRLALVVAPENSAALQLRHHPIDKVVEPAGQVGELDGEAV